MNFPNSPTVGQLYPTTVSTGQPQYRWNGSAWLNVVIPNTSLAAAITARVSCHSVQQSGIVANTWTKVLFDTTDFNHGGGITISADHSRLTPTVAGDYQVVANIFMTAATGTMQLALTGIYKNGVLVSGSQGAAWSAVNQTIVPVIDVISMNGTTDYLECFVYGATSAGTINIAASPTYTFMDIYGSVLSASSALSVGAQTGMVNKFRNGAMDIWQRGISAAADGWVAYIYSGSGTIAQAAGRLLTRFSLQITGAASVTDVVIQQNIESMIAAPLTSQIVTVQAQIYNATGGTITPILNVYHATGPDNGTFTLEPNASAVSLQACPNAVWTQVAYTFMMGALAANGMAVNFDFGNNFGANTKSVRITELDIRATPGIASGINYSPPPPELRPIGIEMPFCLRYLYVVLGAGGGNLILGQCGGPTTAWCIVSFPQPMRVVPTFSYSAVTDWTLLNGPVNASLPVTAMAFNNKSTTMGGIQTTVSSGLVAGNATMMQSSGASAALFFSAEL